MENWFRQLFKSPASDRDKFLARLFGLFSEEIVRFGVKPHGLRTATLAALVLLHHAAKRDTHWISRFNPGRTVRFMSPR